ncbi:MAG: exodeoxyribonuclease VII large subunit [Deltaproteobacteria bacterium]|nr:exodeoxyribonuclease VII large subunit [Deltaproteobacteria bacterium]
MDTILTVTELTQHIRSLLEGSFGFLWVTGEISNCRQPGSGHAYFTLKDETSQIRAVFFRQSLKNIGFKLEDGMNIVCRGRLTVYQQRGEYQLVLDAAEPRGIGALQMAFEQLKKKLSDEGLFDPLRKKKLPVLPRRIGVVTSPTGAAIRDILNITKRRFASVSILIAPVRVQGVEAPPEICEALSLLNSMSDVDVIIVTRGGGSLEDLFPFNDERVARAIAASVIPVVSAVGHEIDFTIADFVADLRAPTPSAAAELVVPSKTALSDAIGGLRERLIRGHRIRRDRLREKIIHLGERMPDPRRVIDDLRITVDDLSDSLADGMLGGVNARRTNLSHVFSLLRILNPATGIANKLLRRDALVKQMTASMRGLCDGAGKRMQKNMALLDMLSPLAVLRRGYGIVRQLPGGMIIRNINTVGVGDTIRVTVSSGALTAKITHTYPGEGEWKN